MRQKECFQRHNVIRTAFSQWIIVRVVLTEENSIITPRLCRYVMTTIIFRIVCLYN